MWMNHSFIFVVDRSVPLPLQLGLAAIADDLKKHKIQDEDGKEPNLEQLKQLEQFVVTKKLFDEFHKQDPAKRE